MTFQELLLLCHRQVADAVASNYIGFIRRALIKAGIPDVPVISLSAQGLESNPGFSYDIPMLKKAMMAVEYGDIFMNVVYRTRPYEASSLFS